MWPLTQIKEAAVSKLVQYTTTEVKEKVSFLEDENWRLQESVNRLELDIENEGYYRLTQASEYTFDKRRLDEIIKLAVQMAIKNPITNRTVNVQADYVFGRGVRFVAKDPLIQEWIDEFCNYRENRKTFTSDTAMRHEERSLQIHGSRFYALNTNRKTGRVIVRCIETSEVEDIIRDPKDYNRELFIRRRYEDGTGKVFVIYHPMLWITKRSGVGKPWDYGMSSDNPVGDIEWDAPVYHLRFNIFGKEKFAVPEIYPQLDWAIAYKRFLEDWTSIIRSFARMALKVTGIADSKKMAAMKSKLKTSVSTANLAEKNPGPTAGAASLLGRGIDIEAVKTAGATTPAKEGAPVLNMAAAASGLPNHFYGDSSQGNYSTAKTLDRPTELKMIARQALWKEAFSDILDYVVHCRGVVEYGEIRETDVFTGEVIYVPQWPAKLIRDIQEQFPDILERNVTDRVRALVNAVTMFGKPLTDIIPDKRLVARLLMEALDIPDIDKLLPTFVTMWEANMKVGDDYKPVDPKIIPPAPPQTSGGAEDAAQGGDVGANG